MSKSDAFGFAADPFYSPRAPLFDLIPLRLVNYFKLLAQFFCRMIQNSFIDMESMFKLFEEDEEVLFKTRQSRNSLSLNAFFIVTFLNIVCVCSLAQVKDEVNAGNLLYKLGKLEFENVYFSYTNGSVHS